jgi:hypothetical protein
VTTAGPPAIAEGEFQTKSSLRRLDSKRLPAWDAMRIISQKDAHRIPGQPDLPLRIRDLGGRIENSPRLKHIDICRA